MADDPAARSSLSPAGPAPSAARSAPSPAGPASIAARPAPSPDGPAPSPDGSGDGAASCDVRDRLALALDVDDLVAALRLARRLRGHFGVAKIGLELYSAAGPEALAAISDLGFRIFLDLKLHDIPTTVRKAARVIGAYGVQYLTAHAQGGADMLSGAVEGLSEGADRAGVEQPSLLAITVLTSHAEPSADAMAQRLATAAEARCQGIVCAVPALAHARRLQPGLMRVTPGIRLAGDAADDQASPASPAAALRGGADLLVIGRSVTHADDPVEAARRIHRSAAEALGRAC